MYKKLPKTAIAIGVICLTIAFFIVYLVKNPYLLHQIRHIPVHVILILLLLYFGLVVSIGCTLITTLLICNLKLPFKEGVLVTMYSSIINFFGPLQSGPVFRAMYLKKRYDLKIKNYTFATAIYYAYYALFSGLFLLSSVLKWWLGLFIVIIVIVLLWCYKSQSVFAVRVKNLPVYALGLLGVATLIQVCLMALIYFYELRYIDPTVHLSQALTYTGAANFALFVALTPGAIGFREAFLIFTRRLSHISLSTIVAANIIDRAIYILLLTILVLCIFGTHANDKLQKYNK